MLTCGVGAGVGEWQYASSHSGRLPATLKANLESNQPRPCGTGVQPPGSWRAGRAGLATATRHRELRVMKGDQKGDRARLLGRLGRVLSTADRHDESGFGTVAFSCRLATTALRRGRENRVVLHALVWSASIGPCGDASCCARPLLALCGGEEQEHPRQKPEHLTVTLTGPLSFGRHASAAQGRRQPLGAQRLPSWRHTSNRLFRGLARQPIPGILRGLSGLSGGVSGDFPPPKQVRLRKTGKGLRRRSEALSGAKSQVAADESACTPGTARPLTSAANPGAFVRSPSHLVG
ncbi:hypothetical protein BX264_1028 [Streptomyces sp. 2333.5]|nr:hypothetical protein BX264_1028 [Streptomyces sp. 2333.5]SED00137.1 hypothetical protein SAMN05428942_1030 [Streptomyces sp. 2112.2]